MSVPYEHAREMSCGLHSLSGVTAKRRYSKNSGFFIQRVKEAREKIRNAVVGVRPSVPAGTDADVTKSLYLAPSVPSLLLVCWGFFGVWI